MPNQFLIHEQSAAFAIETAPCVPPADWTLATAVEFVEFDIDGVKQEMLVDPTAEERAFAVGNRQRVAGRRNAEFGVSLKLHGTGVVTATGQQVAHTYLTILAKHCTGGMHRGTSREVVSGDTLVIKLDDATGIAVGSLVAFEDITAPTPQNDGFPAARRVVAVDLVEDEITLSEALPFTPAEGDLCHAVATAYLDAHVLRDAVAVPGGGTLQWRVRKGDTEALNILLEGCVLSFGIENLSLGALPTMQLAGLCANFRWGAADGVADLQLGTPVGEPQLSLSLDTVVSIQELAETAENRLDINTITFAPGIVRSKVETVTGKTYRFHGLATYSVTPAQTTLQVTLAEVRNLWYAGLQAGKAYRVSITQPGAGAGAGQGWTIHLPCARLVETPGRADVGDNHGVTLSFEASEASDIASPANPDMAKSRFLLGFF